MIWPHQRIFQERAQITRYPELYTESEPIVRTALLSDQSMVGGIQMEIQGEVMSRWQPT